MSRPVSLKKAFYLDEKKKIRTSFLSDVELQSLMEHTYEVQKIVDVGKKILETEFDLRRRIGLGRPRGCPQGIWRGDALKQIIIDDINFNLKSFQIMSQGEVLKFSYDLSPISGSEFQLLKVKNLKLPKTRLSDSKLSNSLVTVTLIFEGENRSIVYDGLKVSV